MSDPTTLALEALRETRFTTYWLDSLDAADDDPALDRAISCDLLVVGGGFCGLWAAIQAREQNPNRDVVLIEANSVANGASGRPAAIMSTSVMHGIDNTERLFPDEVATLEQLGRDNMDDFRETLERYQIDCDLEWGGEMKVSIGDQGLETIEDEFQLYKKYGHRQTNPRTESRGGNAESGIPARKHHVSPVIFLIMHSHAGSQTYGATPGVSKLDISGQLGKRSIKRFCQADVRLR